MNTSRILHTTGRLRGSIPSAGNIRQSTAHRFISTSSFKLPCRAPVAFSTPIGNLSLSPLLQSTVRPTAIKFTKTIPLSRERPCIVTALLRHNYSALAKLRMQEQALKVDRGRDDTDCTSSIDIRRLQPFKANTMTMPPVWVFTPSPGSASGGDYENLVKQVSPRRASKWVVNLRKKDVTVRRYSMSLQG